MRISYNIWHCCTLLQITNYNLEKKLREQGRKLQLHNSSANQHLHQLSSAEEKFKSVSSYCRKLSESQDRLGRNGKFACFFIISRCYLRNAAIHISEVIFFPIWREKNWFFSFIFSNYDSCFSLYIHFPLLKSFVFDLLLKNVSVLLCIQQINGNKM